MFSCFIYLTKIRRLPVTAAPNGRNGSIKPETAALSRRTTLGDFLVSTVFQGVDPVVPDSPTPLLFETLIYDRKGQVAGNQGLYPTWAMAEVGHRRAVLSLRNTSSAGGGR